MHHHRYPRLVHLAAFLLLLLSAGSSYARPDMTPLGPNIADKGSAFYHFSVSTFASADGQRHYKVWTGIPNKAPPKAGYPVLYMLDGNAVMDRLSDSLLEKVSAGSPPVLVVIGYQTNLPFDLNARAYDYTPAVTNDNGEPRRDGHGRSGGGSLAFRHLLEETIAPQAEQQLPVDPLKRGLWGHSYGGLFVLDTYLSSPFFTFYYSASPSLGRDNFHLLNEMRSTNKDRFSHKQLVLMEGNGDSRQDPNTGPSEVLRAVRDTVSSLRASGVAATWALFPGLTHGAMFTPSFQSALLRLSEAQ
ncbi:alpha/beta hydrolase [Erwiniaceae bacterium L1_54_6]|nr:alpha/beta hydrolase [Erwiniaceae bacterium L1_54_6]